MSAPTHTVPQHLSAPAQTWLRHLAGTFPFSPTEWQVAIMAAEARDRSATARRILNREGLTISTPIFSRKGDHVGDRIAAHPAAAIVRDSVATFSRLVAQLGLDAEGSEK